jgi:hypothetical protein
MKPLKKLLLVFIALFSISLAHAQKNINDSAVAFSFPGINYCFMAPAGDLASRFGNNSAIGGSYNFKFKKGWTISVDGQFLFGGNVKEDHLLDGIADDDQKIIAIDGGYADVRLYERGYHFTLNVGKIFSFKRPNPNSGIWITAGAGLLQHKIRIENIGNNAPQLSKEYKKGYDKLTNGLALREFIGYVYFGKKRLVNFYAGFEFVQAFTKSRRDYNFDTRTRDNESRTDMLNGIRLGWLLPLYKRPPDKYYLY